MTRDVMLTITGLHTMADADNDNVTMEVPAEYFKKNESHYLLYEESMEGFEGICKTRIKFTGNRLEMTKKGIVNTCMSFEENKTWMTEYTTPYGSLLLGVHTGKMVMEEQADHISIIVEYALEMNEKLLSDCRIEIEIHKRL